jgi:hypothetical protein
MFIAWIVVGAAGLATLAGVFVLTRFIGLLWLRSLVRCLAAVWLLIPAKIQEVPGYYAPAYIVAIFEGMFRREGDPGPAIVALMAGTLVVAALFLGVAAWHWHQSRNGARNEAVAPSDPPIDGDAGKASA